MSNEPQVPADIVNHKLSWARFKMSPNHGGYLIRPTLLLIHYTAGTSVDGAVASLCDPLTALPPTERHRRSAHVVVGRNGDAVQLVPFNTVAWHAGQSSWKGRLECNFFSVGIELDNPGWLIKNSTGRWAPKDNANHVYDDADVLVAKHKFGGPVLGWLKYTEQQMDSLDHIASALRAAYPTIEDTAGHDDVAPARKRDPGPAFPMDDFRQRIFGNSSSV